MPVIWLTMRGIHRHYASVAIELEPPPEAPVMLPATNRAIVLVSKLHLPTLRALAYARATSPSHLEAITVDVDEAETLRLKEEWDRSGMAIPLTIIASPYREITRPVMGYVKRLRRESPRDIVTVYIPEYVLGHWWEQVLHNQTALRLKARLLQQRGVVVASVPYQLSSATRKQAHGLEGSLGPAAPRAPQPARNGSPDGRQDEAAGPSTNGSRQPSRPESAIPCPPGRTAASAPRRGSGGCPPCGGSPLAATSCTPRSCRKRSATSAPS